MEKELIDKLEEYEFECEAGYLTNCLEWLKLKEILLKKEV